MATNTDFVIEFIGQLDKSELNRAIEEFSRKQIDLKVNTDEIKEAIKEFAKANDIKISTREIDAWTKKFINAQAEAQKASEKRLEYERQALEANGNLEESHRAKAVAGIEQQTNAQMQLNQSVQQMNQTIANDNTNQRFLQLSKEYDKLGKKIQSINDNNVGFFKQNEEIALQAQQITQQYEQLRQVMASGDIGSISGGITELTSGVDNLGSSIRKAKSDSQTFFEMLKENFTKFGAWSIITFGYFALINQMKDAVNQVIELDASLVELRKVTDLSGSALEKFTEDAFKAGQEVGRTGKEVIDATAEFARSGYTIKESLDLGKEALKLRNVSENINSASESALILISTLKAYNMEASEAGRITDVLNEVSNTSAINFDSLAEGVTRTASVYSLAGTSIEELTGLLTGLKLNWFSINNLLCWKPLRAL